MVSGRFIIPTTQHVLPIQQLISSYPPVLSVPVYSHSGQPISQSNIMFPYTVDDICSRCMRIAAAPRHPDASLYLEELRVNLAHYDPNMNQELLRVVRALATALTSMFAARSWYDNEYTAPHRFVGFLDGTFDMIVIKE